MFVVFFVVFSCRNNINYLKNNKNVRKETCSVIINMVSKKVLTNVFLHKLINLIIKKLSFKVYSFNTIKNKVLAQNSVYKLYVA